MNPTYIGKAIAALRKSAGYTQAALAELLDVSDKAVSKWERGLACPDISLFPKLSVLLDTDIDDLINGEATERHHQWKGILILDDLAAVPVYTKPLVYFLLQNFLLVGIRDILVLGGNVETLLGSGAQWGIRLTYHPSSSPACLKDFPDFLSSNVMIIYGNALVYGANLTRRYQSMMLYQEDAVDLITDGQRQVPIVFCRASVWNSLKHRMKNWKEAADMLADLQPAHKAFSRGMVVLPMENMDQILTAGRFVQIIEQSEGTKIADLEEIADNRSLIRLKLLQSKEG